MELLFALAFLVCPLVMGGMMVLKMRQMRRGATDGALPREDQPR